MGLAFFWVSCLGRGESSSIGPTSGSLKKSSEPLESEPKIDMVRLMSSAPTEFSALKAWMYPSTALPMDFRADLSRVPVSLAREPLEGVADEEDSLLGEPVVGLAVLLADLVEQLGLLHLLRHLQGLGVADICLSLVVCEVLQELFRVHSGFGTSSLWAAATSSFIFSLGWWAR